MTSCGYLLIAAGLTLVGGAFTPPTPSQRAVPLRPCRRLFSQPRMLDVDHKEMLPYDVPEQPKPFADYEWDPEFPGSFKPGTRGENYDLDVVLEMWEGRDNPSCMELPQDQLWQVSWRSHCRSPLSPPSTVSLL